MFLRMAGGSCGQEVGPDPPGDSLHCGVQGREGAEQESKREEVAKVTWRFLSPEMGLIVAFQTKAETTVMEMFGRKTTSILALLNQSG